MFKRDRPQFEAIKRKLTFDEDFMSPTPQNTHSLPFECGAQIEKNPFMQLLESSDTVPTFDYSNTAGLVQESNNRETLNTGGKNKHSRQQSNNSDKKR